MFRAIALPLHGFLFLCIVTASVQSTRADSAFALAPPLDLKIDFGGGPVAPGFTGVPGISGSVTVGSVTVNYAATASTVDRGAGGPLLQDFIYGNPIPMTVSVSGLNPAAQYTLKLYSIDINANGSTYTQTFYANGVNIGSLAEDGGSGVPANPAAYTITATVSPNGSGVLNILADTPGTLGGSTFSHLNGFELTEIIIPVTPEPGTLLLGALSLGLMAISFWRHRRLSQAR